MTPAGNSDGRTIVKVNRIRCHLQSVSAIIGRYMENREFDEMTDIPASENTEDLGFLAETSVLEKLTESGEKPKKDVQLSETRVFERLTDGDEKEDLSKTGALAKLTDQDGVEKDGSSQKSFRSNAVKEVVLFFRDLAIHLAIVLIVVNFILRPIQVRGSSMYPTLSNGNMGVSNLLGYSMDGIRRFDIVIIYVEDKNEYLVKRCVGLPGETIAYKDEVLYVNGEAVDEPFFDEEYVNSYSNGFTDDVDEITLGADEYFCVGDNRPHSTDSRYYGPFRKDQIVSKGVFIFFPFSSFGVQTW